LLPQQGESGRRLIGIRLCAELAERPSRLAEHRPGPILLASSIGDLSSFAQDLGDQEGIVDPLGELTSAAKALVGRVEVRTP
jgi:hypothetical protein